MLLRPLSFCYGIIFTLIVGYFLEAQYSSVTRYVRKAERKVEQAESPAPTATNLSKPPSSLRSDVTNRTLGFERILAINMPERSDRRDLLTLTAAINDVELDWIESVKGSEMSRKAWPAHWATGKKNLSQHGDPPSLLGSWRSHVNAVRKVVESGWSSALIIEDDADWDVALKSQLENFADSARALSNAGRNESLWITPDTPTHSPYGDDWDILWLGSCANPPAPANTKTFPGDGGHTFYVFAADGGMACTFAYAVNHRSARTLMGFLLDLDEPMDFALSSYCGRYRCIVVWPQLIGEHKPAGSFAKDSNMRASDDGFRAEGNTRNIVHSAILDMLRRFGRKEPFQ